jgi:hypothetical protein
MRRPQLYTPNQILEAAHRAEAEGRADYARHFFQHIATSYPRTQEATAAIHGMTRLQPVPPKLAPVRRSTSDGFRRAHHVRHLRRHRYIVGRGLAALLSWAAFGLVTWRLMVLVTPWQPQIELLIPHWLPELPLASTVGACLAAILTGQVLRALFDIASALIDTQTQTRMNHD